MSKSIPNLGREILYETPGTISLLVAGCSAYMSEADPAVREKLTNTKHQVRHWAQLYAWEDFSMPLLAGVGILSALGALFQSKEKMFLWGAGVLAAIKPFTQLFIQKTNNRLN